MKKAHKITFEKILPLRVMEQIRPTINPKGDCGICVLGGLQGVAKTSRTEFQIMYKNYSQRDYRNAKKALNYPNMIDALWTAKSNDWISDFNPNVPIWPQYSADMVWGVPSSSMGLEWFHYIKIAIQAGYYGITFINAFGRGPNVNPNHWVMICGVREVEIPVNGSSKLEQEVLISNSSEVLKPEFWENTWAFLTSFGGYNTILVKP